MTPDLHYSFEPSYYFHGLAPEGYLGAWEQSVWLGFIPWLLLIVLILGILARADGTRTPAVWLASAFFSFHLLRSVLLKYADTSGIYYAYPIALSAPALAWLWETRAAILRIVSLAVLVTNLVSATSTFAFSPYRNLPELVALGFRPRSGLVSPELAAFLGASCRTFITYSQWDLPYLDLMSVQPASQFRTGPELPATQDLGGDVAFVLERENAAYGEVPILFEHDDRQRLTLLGTMITVYGPQRAFGRAAPKAEPVRAPTDAPILLYEAAGEDDAGVLATGWSFSERTHRWSDGRESVLKFKIPRGWSGCALDATAITAGPQQTSWSLNDHEVDGLAIQGWFPGVPLRFALPDDDLMSGGVNPLVLRFEHPQQDASDRLLALGIVRLALICQNHNPAVLVDENSTGFALLQLDEMRDSSGGLTALQVLQLYRR